VSLSPAGRETIEKVFPRFNEHEATFTARLAPDEQRELARLLRVVTATASGSNLVAEDESE
jgi:DNA-binding MarR family transcriptional regulator